MSKILIVEDDQIVASIYRNKFLADQFEVEVALDGETGFELAKKFRPDAIVLDLILPKLTGIELMRKLRAESGFENTPLIVFSNTYLTNMVQEAWKAGATKCLSKANCTPRQVIDVVRAALGNNGAGLASPASGTDPGPSGQPAPAATSTAAQPVTSDADTEFLAELRKSFVATLPGTLNTLRAQLQSLIKADGEATRQKPAQELYRTIHALTSNAGIGGFLLIAQMCDALEALLKELYEKPKNINASTLRTVALAIDFLGFLFEHGTRPEKQVIPNANILVVDDEAISRRAVTYALEKAKLKSASVEDPNVAFKLLSENPYDLIFLDVDMPGMNGFELCTKLRALPQHKKTPVVFVTSLNDFESRASSTMCGGNNLIAKPFLFIELAVKALVYILRGKVQPVKRVT